MKHLIENKNWYSYQDGEYFRYEQKAKPKCVIVIKQDSRTYRYVVIKDYNRTYFNKLIEAVAEARKLMEEMDAWSYKWFSKRVEADED